MITWDILYKSFKENPRDVSTHPITKATPKRFYAYSDKEDICIRSSALNKSSCRINKVRKLKPERFEAIYAVYNRRENGDKVSREAAGITRHTSYWYGVFYALEHGN